jgi:SAM-dependent methyltransferase
LPDTGWDEQRLALYRRYLGAYFAERFLAGQGTEEILSMMASVGDVDEWLDLGCGTTTLFWSIGLRSAGAIDCCDKHPEALKVLSDFLRSDDLPPCYVDALTLLGATNRHLDRMRRRFRAFIVADLMDSNSRVADLPEYGLVTVFGLLGLAPSAEMYGEALAEAARKVRGGGYLAGADWIRSAKFVERDGFDNRYLSMELTAAAAKAAGMTVLDVKEVRICDDSLYDRVIVWRTRNEGRVPVQPARAAKVPAGAWGGRDGAGISGPCFSAELREGLQRPMQQLGGHARHVNEWTFADYDVALEFLTRYAIEIGEA